MRQEGFKMQLTLEEKREIVVKNKDPAIAAIQSVLDSYYNLLAPYTDKHNVLKKNSFETDEQRNFAKTLQSDIIIYENLLKKVRQDITLNEVDIAYIGIVFQFCVIRAKKQIEDMQKALDLCISISEQLYSEIKKT